MPEKKKEATKDKNQKAKDDSKKEKESIKPSRPLTETEIFDILTHDVVAAVSLVERHVHLKERKFTLRALRRNSALRRRITKALFHRVLPLYYPVEKASFVQQLLSLIDSVSDGEQEIYFENIQQRKCFSEISLTASTMAIEVESKQMAVDDVDADEEPTAKELTGQRTAILPEVDVFLRLLVVLFLLNHDKYEQAQKVVKEALDIVRHNDFSRRRTLEPFSWRIERYSALIDEKLKIPAAKNRSSLLAALRQATLRHDSEGTVTLLCIAVRGYLLEKQSSQAFKLLSRTPIQAETVSSSQLARLLYYQGRIKAIQLEYSASFSNLSQAARKAPRTGARGFQMAVVKSSIVVQLLMGEVPERSIFTNQLAAYLALARAVRTGDVKAFEKALETNRSTYESDNLLTLVERLRHNVLKAGLRKICVSYSRISLVDVAQILSLANEDEAESIVAKAIRDGVIDAVIDSNEGFIRSRPQDDVYTTYGPTEAFHTRVEFCFKVHDEAVQAMRYADKLSRLEEERKERERTVREERELAAQLEEDDDDDME